MYTYANSINGSTHPWVKDAMNRVSTNGLFVAFFFKIGVMIKNIFNFYITLLILDFSFNPKLNHS
ncbi:hypothetical protein A4S05_04555 [Nostoc sp. KVJ20]|nr:hypothetical protein A4S05_04555 [Nostoc sp. KVJ20]